MQNYNPRNPINFHDLIVMADELYEALSLTIDTILSPENELCPICNGQYIDDRWNGKVDEYVLDHNEDCSLGTAIELRRRITVEGQLKAVKKLHKVSN